MNEEKPLEPNWKKLDSNLKTKIELDTLELCRLALFKQLKKSVLPNVRLYHLHLINLKTELSSLLNRPISNLEANVLNQNQVQTNLASLLNDLETIIIGKKKNPKNKKDSTKKKEEDAVPDVSDITLDTPNIESDEEWMSDDDEIIPFEPKKVAKKNRRGQRARREIWEQKYKDKAVHLSLPPKETDKTSKLKKGTDKKQPVEKLHPSWEAKKQNKAAIVEGKGSKIVFGNDQQTNDSAKQSNKRSAEEHLHPSWAAKKAKSVGIIPSKGSKIVFGENSESTKIVSNANDNLPRLKAKPIQLKPTENLHPSWAAKNQAKNAALAKLQSAKPTKITFDD
ncbi:hypothetical protein BC833DRAFT_568321 [Globomyces pollinis-pini]|nr:hypothetical protein BC833DRAFT_568321 [Globomyces pollinis-pini]